MVGKTVYWGNLKGEIKIEQIDSILVSFESIGDYYFHKDGRLYQNTPPILSFVPYNIPKFEQPIEKDTLVWCRDSVEEIWSARYYSHNNNGVHYCFNDQLKSHQTNKKPTPWVIVQTESPFTHD